MKNLNKSSAKKLTRCQTAKVVSEAKTLKAEEGKV